MPRGTKLSQKEQGQIIALRKEGFTEHSIATRIGRSNASIHQFLAVNLFLDFFLRICLIFRILRIMALAKDLVVHRK